LAKIRAHIAGLRAGKPRVVAPELHAEYLALVLRARDLIARKAVLHRGQLLRSYTAKHAAENKRRMKLGFPSLGERNAAWQSWIPPDIRADLTERFRVAYSNVLQGRKFHPFAPRVYRMNQKDQIERLRATIARIRAENRHTAPAHERTTHNALMLAGARAAERNLEYLLETRSDLNHFDKRIPVNWTALIHQPLRKRVLAAMRDPSTATKEGLEAFL
jgi:hypothetical protein